MSKPKLIFILFLTVIGFLSYGQQIANAQPPTAETKIIAVVNRADWCAVCKANGERFDNNIRPYTTKGLAIVVNDLTNDSTIAKSKANLKKKSLYKQIYLTKRKGVGHLMEVCGLIHGKEKTIPTGIVIFVDAKNLKVLRETSISISDKKMKTIIDNLLKLKQ